MTMVDHSYWLATFAAWAELRGVNRPADVTLPVLEAYQRHVSLRRKPDGTPLSWSTQARALVALRAFFAWCKKTRRLLSNPAAELVMPRQSHKLPWATLTHAEAEVVLAVPDTATVIGLRDRAVLELLYATAMRRGELVGLDLPDVDLARGWLTLRVTKTRWDRVVPMGERAAAWLVRYLADARPHLVRDEAVPGRVPGHQRRAPGRDLAHGPGAPLRARRPGRARPAAATCSGTRPPPSCSKAGRTSATSRSCSGTAALLPPTSTPVSPPSAWPPCTPPPTPAPPCPATASFLFSRLAALVSGPGAARWDTRDHDGGDGRDHDPGRAVPESALDTPSRVPRPPERRPAHHVPARQRGFCPSRRLRHASDISVAGDDPVNEGDPTGLATNLGGTAAWAFNNVYTAGNDGYTTQDGDCTDFVSRALNEGGGDQMSFGSDPPFNHTDDTYWYRKTFLVPTLSGPRTYTMVSYSWASAYHLAHHLLLVGGTELVGPANEPPCPNDQGWTSAPGWEDVQPGDIAFANFRGSNFSGIDHAGVITSDVAGVPYITQHGPSQQSVPISYWLSSAPYTHVWIIQPK